MKRTVPLLLTAIGGFVLIVAYFIPATEGWGEVAAIWFDILASIAFVLGGGNLLKSHLKKISDRKSGWGYSGVTILAFVITLVVGLWKIGSQPAPQQEYFGESFADLPLSKLPESMVARINGSIPQKANREKLPSSVRLQLSQSDGQLIFRGWMHPNQKNDLIDFQNELEWQCTVEKLFEAAQPSPALTGKVAYYAEHESFGFNGFMTDEHSQALLGLSDNATWKQLHDELREEGRRATQIPLETLPEGMVIPDSLRNAVSFDASATTLEIKGPMSTGQRDALAEQYPLAKPLRGERRTLFRAQLESLGPHLNEPQSKTFNRVLDGTWTSQQLRDLLDAEGKAQKQDKTACEMLEEMNAGVAVIERQKTVGQDVQTNDRQTAVLDEFAVDDKMTVDQLVNQLREAGELASPQEEALRGFLGRNPTVGQRNKTLCFALLRAGPLNPEQREFLLKDYRGQYEWRTKVGELFAAAHLAKFPQSGDYREQGTPFWWIYEYAFKPLTATMFAMLAFYVASAAFRAFRAKNIEAMLLLGTAFVILLGRTFAGVLLTSWFPDAIAGLKIENLTVTIMSVFNTAGNRAIMIGIALGIASMSLKVLLGVDRSYLGSSED